jgi:hypothetical protein
MLSIGRQAFFVSIFVDAILSQPQRSHRQEEGEMKVLGGLEGGKRATLTNGILL